MKKFILLFFSVIICNGLFAQTSDEQIRQAANSLGVPFDDLRQFVQMHQRADTSYMIGDTGPAGGLIFYDKGDDIGGWQYLEVAPASTEFKSVWGAHGKTVGGTGTDIGDGKNNTDLIVAFMNRDGETGAAQYCNDLDYNGFSDWFLPSKAELGMMYRNLKMKDLDDFTNDEYWSSSEYNNDGTWHQRFSDGKQDYSGNWNTTNKWHPLLVRAIRRF
jgi:hypothetical protein